MVVVQLVQMLWSSNIVSSFSCNKMCAADDIFSGRKVTSITPCFSNTFVAVCEYKYNLICVQQSGCNRDKVAKKKPQYKFPKRQSL